MKFLHLSDLHIGKVVNGFSLLEDQRYILQQLVRYVREVRPEAVVISGDIYDKQVPGGEAVKCFDQFITDLAEEKISILLISGNHDSPERLSFLSRIMQENHIFFHTVFDGKVKTVSFYDEYGEVIFHLLPFIKPSVVKYYYGKEEIKSYDDAMRAVVAHMEIDQRKRNVLLSHQFVVKAGQSPIRSDSEVDPIGGIDSINSSLLERFDYVALGHLHGAQQIGGENIYYCGSPLKYSFSEHRHHKTAHLVELLGKGEIELKRLPLIPLRDMRKIRGPMQELLNEKVVRMENTEDYIHITLTDEDEIPDAIGKVRKIYKNTMVLAFDNKRTQSQFALEEPVSEKEPFELFRNFFELQNGRGLTKEQDEIVLKLLRGDEL